MYQPIQLKTKTSLVRNSISRSLLRYGLLVIPLLFAFLAMPGIVRGQVVGGDLFSTVNLGGTYNNGASPIYQYTPQYVPPGGTPNIFASGLDTPRGLAFDKRQPADGGGNLYVAINTTVDNSVDPPVIQGSILKTSSDGLMSPFAIIPEVGFVQGVAVDSAGNLFVSSFGTGGGNSVSTSLYKIIPGGAISTFATLPDLGVGIAFDSAGNIYVATGDGNGNNGQVLKFTPDYNPSLGTGTVTTFIGSADFPMTATQGLAFDAHGYLFVSTISSIDNSGDIRKFGPDGIEITPRFATGLTKSPRGLAFDSNGNLFLAELGVPGTAITGDILEFAPDGTQTVFASQNFGTRGNRGPEWLAFTTGAVTPPSTAVTLTFPNATVPLTTTVTSVDPSSLPPPSTDFEGTANLTFDITITGTPTPPIILGFTVDPSLNVSTLKVLHYENNNWVDETITFVGCDNQGQNCNWMDSAGTPHPAGQAGYPAFPADNTVYASVNSLSPFTIAAFKYSAQVQQPINADGTSVFNAKRGVVPVVFKLMADGVPTCQLPPATISVFRTSGGVVGSIDERVYLQKSDSGSNFRIDTTKCQYSYNLGASALGPGTYQVYISIGGSVAGSATFALK